MLTIFLGIMLLASILSIKGRFPYTIVLVFIGIALTLTTVSLPFPPSIQYGLSQIRSLTTILIPQEQPGGQVGGLFVGLVVPPLIFQAMMQIKPKDLRAILRPALFLATIGVGIATAITGLALWKAAGLSFAAAFLFAAIISPTDTATVIEIFHRLKVPSKLSSMLELEAAFNDATAIVIFALVLGSLTATKQFPIFGALGSFVLTFGGGVVIGFLMAFISEILHPLISDKLSETVLTIFAVYGSYTLATGFGVSGLIAVTIVGLYFGNITLRSSMSPATRETISTFWQIAAFVGNSIAFLFIGLQTEISAIVPALTFIALAYVAVTLARMATVYPILSIFSRLGDKIPIKWMNVATLGGMRGALSIALALSLTTSSSAALLSTTDVGRIHAMVLGVAFISIIAQGGLLYRYVRRNFSEDVSLGRDGEDDEGRQQVSLKLLKSIDEIGILQSLRKKEKITDEEFDSRLEHEREELKDAISQMDSTQESAGIKAGATRLYSIFTTPVDNAADELLNKSKNNKPDSMKPTDDGASNEIQQETKESNLDRTSS